jgi:hypothetical protein
MKCPKSVGDLLADIINVLETPREIPETFSAFPTVSPDVFIVSMKMKANRNQADLQFLTNGQHVSAYMIHFLLFPQSIAILLVGFKSKKSQTIKNPSEVLLPNHALSNHTTFTVGKLKL